MKHLKTKITAVASAALVLATTLAPAALAHGGYGRGGYYRDRGYNGRYYRGYANNWSRDQYIKKAAIGGGAGALIGGLMAPEGYRTGSAVKGGLIGAGAGLGYEYLRRRW